MLYLSSNQDFATRLAICDAVILDTYQVLGRRPTNAAQVRRIEQLHAAMGYRADQPEY